MSAGLMGHLALASHPGRSSNIPSRFMLRKPDISAGLMGHLALASHPGGSGSIPSRFMLRKPDISAGLMGHLAPKQTLPYCSSVPRHYLFSVWDLSGVQEIIAFAPCFSPPTVLRTNPKMPQGLRQAMWAACGFIFRT